MKKSKLLALSTGIAISLAGVTVANAQSKPFQNNQLQSGYANPNKTTNNQGQNNTNAQNIKLAEGHCGSNGHKNSKCKDKGCGASHKSKEKSCGSHEKGKDASCGAGTCGS